MDLVTRVVPPATLDETMAKARAALEARRVGRRHDGAGHDGQRDELRAYQQLRAQGELPVRITSHQNHGIDGLVAAGVTTGFGDDWLRIGGIKLFADGSMGSGTAAFFAPYADDPSTSGLLIQSPDGAGEEDVRRRRRGLPGDRARDRRPRQRRRARHLREAAAGARGRAIGARASSTPRSCATPTSAFRDGRRHRVDSAEPLHRRHALGRKADRPRAREDRLRLQVVRRRRRPHRRSAPTGSSSR